MTQGSAKPEAQIAHVRRDGHGNWATHPLQQHLQHTAELAAQFASSFDAEDWARLAGLWHDLGKYNPDFQQYIRRASGFETEAHLEDKPGRIDHSTAGAIFGVEKSKAVGTILAYAIAGHHAGLPDWYKSQGEGKGLSERIANVAHLAAARSNGLPTTLTSTSLPATVPPKSPEHAHLWMRLLFSCLVDADFLDTESFMSQENTEQRGQYPNLVELHRRMQRSMKNRDEAVRRAGNWELPVNQARRIVLGDCITAALNSPGIFTLTVPTGGGKTLSSVAFALRHAEEHKKRRVIVAIPYTSIIEQTAKVLRGALGEDAVLEHHSNFDPDRETPRARLAAENWDAPVIVTTNVQLFESLFANRTSRCRKLHNIVNSVIILDEAQMLPAELLMPTLSTLKGLVEHFGCTVVMCTATQPALIGQIGSGTSKFEGLQGTREIIQAPESLFRSLKRVNVSFRNESRLEWAELSEQLLEHDQVLCVVNRRQDCRDLFETLQARCTDRAVHLSALMCGEHRSEVIATIKRGLGSGQALRVVSTQLVEAGVDIDFPVVYRAMAGLDSIAQAAGRCNREGKLNTHGTLGQVIVFNPPKSSPKGLLLKGEQKCAELLRTMREQCRNLEPEAFTEYFRLFFQSVNDHGRADFEDYLVRNVAKAEFQFASAAAWYRLIDDGDSRSVVVWHEGPKFSSRRVLDELRRFGPNRLRMRRLQRCTVNVPTRAFLSLKEQRAISEVAGPDGPTGVWSQCVPELYDSTFGLRLEGPQYDNIDFVC